MFYFPSHHLFSLRIPLDRFDPFFSLHIGIQHVDSRVTARAVNDSDEFSDVVPNNLRDHFSRHEKKKRR